MHNAVLITLLIFGLLPSAIAQKNRDILLIDTRYNISVSSDKLIKVISVRKGMIRKTKFYLLKQCSDSTRYYSGNCFKVTYYNENEYLTIGKNRVDEDYIRGEIYLLDDSEIQKIRAEIANYKKPRADTSQFDVSNNDTLKVVYEANFAFQYGGESKLTLLPKVNLLRKHKLKLFTPYYGIELGLHPLLTAGSFSFSGICGLEKKFISLETSVSHYRTTKISDGSDGYLGPFSQNLLNTKLGIRIKGVKLKIGTSFLLSENIPNGQERIPLLDVGKINGTIYSVEVQFKIK